MGKGWKIGEYSGIGVFVHWSFILLPVWIAVSTLMGGGGILEILVGLVWIAAVFGCVVLHEFGHALAARRFGIGTKDITLLPIGGVARLDRIPRKPGQEFLIAVAGPAVNVAIALILGVVLFLTGSLTQAFSFSLVGSSFLFNLLAVNIGLVVFNMIPAFPMDGGRVFRSVLAFFLPYVKATDIAATVGQVVAVGFGILAVSFGEPMLLLLAAFVFFAGRAEAGAVRQREEHRIAQHLGILHEPLRPGMIAGLKTRGLKESWH
ncbi:MAG: Zn-dependent protease [Pirellulaceae bacterium]|jgi:Zn-dependent protease